MKVIATNIGTSTTIQWKGQEVQTGIYKYPTQEPLHLGKEDVAKDSVVDRRYHGGVDKACYLFSAEQYPYWKALYPDLDWDWGMLGENLTVEGLDESQIRIGNIYRLGTALVQISQPRQPCYKLGVRFNNQDILGQFVAKACPGTYVRVLEEGTVTAGDTFELVEVSENELTVKQYFQFLYQRVKDPETLALARTNTALPQSHQEDLKKIKQ
ncbi:MOSC domain-containing protein [Spongiimicrobium salis]|uniref:MOSC domain-containing protein n=1 Tax=Spongiimicrobium salis TaxID=1667022 RepID=UPI00374D2F87